MLQQDEPDDYVISTGETHSVKEWVEAAFDRAGLDLAKYIWHDRSLCRPAEVDILRGDAAKAHNVLGWEPKIRFKELVNIMVDADAKMADRSIAVSA